MLKRESAISATKGRCQIIHIARIHYYPVEHQCEMQCVSKIPQGYLSLNQSIAEQPTRGG